MKIVWVDVCFAINFCADYLICLLAARVCASPLKRGRYALAALFGALWAVAAAAEGSFFVSPGGKLLAAAVMCLAAFYGQREFSRLCAAFFALSAALGGAVWALSLGSGGGIRVSLPLLGLSFLLFWAAFSVFLREVGKKREREILEIELRFCGRAVRLRALRDTGNALSDPISGKHVMVAAPCAVKELFAPYEALLDLPDPAELLSCADALDALRGRLRLVPYTAVGAKGFLAAFRPDYLSVNGKERRDLLVALSPSASGDGFDAVL